MLISGCVDNMRHIPSYRRLFELIMFFSESFFPIASLVTLPSLMPFWLLKRATGGSVVKKQHRVLLHFNSGNT